MQRRAGWPNGKPKSVLKTSATCHPERRHFARGLCRECYGPWHWKNRGQDLARTKAPEYFRERHFRSKYGITTAERDAMAKAQGHACAICRRPDGTGKSEALHVDHCHRTGKIRGLLCGECNRAIGLLGDDPDRIRAAAEYLR